jgi:hypothetical protein
MSGVPPWTSQEANVRRRSLGRASRHAGDTNGYVVCLGLQQRGSARPRFAVAPPAPAALRGSSCVRPPDRLRLPS